MPQTPMRSFSAAVVALRLSVVLMQTANGLFGELLGVRLGQDGAVSSQVAGLVMSGYFVGMVLGSLTCGRIIERVGHVRAFAALMSIVSATAIAHSFYVEPLYWFVLRTVFGFCMAGAYMVAESWLNGATSNDQRGSLLSIYMVLQYSALGGGQFLLNLSPPSSFVLYGFVSILFSLSLVPLTLSRSAGSGAVSPSALSFRELYRISPLGVIGGFASGVIAGAIFGTGSVFAIAIGFDVSEVAIFVSASIIGGLILQWPIGKVSDVFDRRTVITVALFVTAVLGVLLALLPFPGFWPFIALATAYGGVGMSLYSLSVAHANDHIDPADLVPASAGLLLAFGIGAVIGPIASTTAMDTLGHWSFYGFGALVSALVGCFALWRMTQRAAVPMDEQGPWVAVSRTSPMASEIDPRWDPEAEEEADPQPSEA